MASFNDVIGGRNVVSDITRCRRAPNHPPRAARALVTAVLGAAVVQADSSRPRSATKSRYSPRSLQGSSRPDSGDHRNA